MRILIGLIEHMGDIVACEPVARYMRYNNPDSHITWAVSEPFRELIDTNPFIDETLVLGCLTDWMKLTKHGSHDKVVDLHVNYRICEHCRIPLVKNTGNPFINAYEWFDYGALLEAFSSGAGLPRLSAQPMLYLQPEHVGAVDGLNLPNEFCVVHRESNSAAKDWTAQGWSKLYTLIREQLKLAVVEVGTRMVTGPSPLDDHCINLVNRLPILQTAEVIRRARFFVGVDSGPAHLANALRVPGVVLLGRFLNFRQYMPFTGFFASMASDVKILRNLAGPARDLTLDEVWEAVRYVHGNTHLPAPSDYTVCQSSKEPGLVSATKLDPELRNLVISSGLFDSGWYAVHNPEFADDGLGPIDHYLKDRETGTRAPSPKFDAARYLAENADVATAGKNPLLHYLQQGRAERRHYHPAHADPGPRNVEAQAPIVIGELAAPTAWSETTKIPREAEEIPRTFAFYLPQFHPIAENNWAHGMGFTEWHNVVKARPLFKGHYQPKIPGELGYYDLRAEETLHQQVNLALEYGLTGFCFYYYYFQGRKLLFNPIKNYVKSDLKAPFFFLWANENWSKRWDGGDQEVIISQQHGRQDDLAFIRELAQLFADDRYVKVAGKPVLMIYKTHLFPDVRSTVEIWREEILKLGFPGIYLVMVDDWTSDRIHPRDLGFDASYEIPSNLVPEHVLISEPDSLDLVEGFNGRIVDYRKFAQYHMGRPFPEYKRFRTVMLPWDNTARHGSRAMVHVDGTRSDYKTWLLQALIDTHARYAPEERIVFVHSWNEWCEGTHLEPDGRLGRFFLEQTGEAIRIARQAIDLGKSPKTAAVIAELLAVAQAKDEGAFRAIQATRLQSAQRMAHLISELENAKARLEHLVRAGDSAQESLRAVHASTSWRATKPLRSLGRLLRKT